MTRLALAGAGWAARVHALAASTVDGVSIPVVAARSTASAAAVAESIGATPVTADALPGRADAVVIATPPVSHAPLAVRMLDAGVPVLVEKPLAATLVEADAVVAAAERSGVSACYAENLLFAPAVDVAIARAARLGALDHLEVRMTGPSPAWGHFAEPLSAGGALFDLGAHALALAVVLAAGDEPVAVRARLDSVRDDGADDVARVEIRFASDLIAPVDVSWRGETTEWSAQAASAAGSVRLELRPDVGVEADGEPVALPGPTGTTDLDERIGSLGYAAQTEGFVAVVRRRGGRVCPVGFGRAVLELTCAAYLSAGRDGDEVVLPYDGPRDLTPMQLWRGEWRRT